VIPVISKRQVPIFSGSEFWFMRFSTAAITANNSQVSKNFFLLFGCRGGQHAWVSAAKVCLLAVF
jgi:hypothetical protein